MVGARPEGKPKVMPQLDQDYVFLPQRLLADLRANPAAIGAYALIARLFLVYQEPIPLSAADLQRYDPSLRYGAARGALQRLVALGWLQEHRGHKNRYLPTWGIIKGAALPWRMDAPTLGRPAHVVTLRLDRRLLDIGLGRIIPHPLYPAETHNRYLERPIFTLRDVGAYAQALGGQTLAATPALWRYGLVRDGGAQPLHSAADLIARASQRTIEGDGAALTAQGLRLLGLDYPNEHSVPSSKQTLFFVDHALIPDLIPPVIPDLIPPQATAEQRFCGAELEKTDPEDQARVMPGNRAIPSESSDSPPNPPARPFGGGGGDLPPMRKSEREERQPETRESAPESEAAKLLRSIGAFPSSVEELADCSAELIAQAITYAEAEPGIASPAGWVVEALRRHRDEGWPIPEPRIKRLGLGGDGDVIDAATYVGGAYGDLFRLGSDLSGLEDDLPGALAQEEAALPSVMTDQDAAERREQRHEVFARETARSTYAERCYETQDLGHPKAPVRTAALPAHAGIGALEQPALSILKSPMRQIDGPDERIGAQRPADPERPPATDAALTQELRAELLLRCGRRYRPIIAGLEVQTSPGTTVLICASVSDMTVVQNELLGAVHSTLARLGAPTPVAYTTRAGHLVRRSHDGHAPSREVALSSPGGHVR
jgi:hypothetical protein